MSEALQQDLLNAELVRLCAAGRLPLDQLNLTRESLEQLGFSVDADSVALPADLELLNSDQIRAQLSDRASGWLQRLDLSMVTGSTNTELLEAARTNRIDGWVRLAELQTAGRGRRGRPWLSPIGQNLALSLGALIPLEASKLGGFSLAVGLAVHDVLDSVGAAPVALKWPNDVLLAGAKIAGILVELTAHPEGTQVVVGVGINVRIPKATGQSIEQAAADLSALHPPVSRNQLAAKLISSLHDYVRGFEISGFAPMRELFNAHHALHLRSARVLLGSDVIHGVVAGVSDQGELILNNDGVLTTYSSGEISLRSDSSAD